MNQKPTYEELEQRVRELEKAEFEGQLEEKLLQEQVLHHRVLMDVSLDGVAIIDQKHRVVESNRRFAEMLGYTPEEVLSLHTWDWEATMTEAEIRANFADLTKTKTTFINIDCPCSCAQNLSCNAPLLNGFPCKDCRLISRLEGCAPSLPSLSLFC